MQLHCCSLCVSTAHLSIFMFTMLSFQRGCSVEAWHSSVHRKWIKRCALSCAQEKTTVQWLILRLYRSCNRPRLSPGGRLHSTPCSWLCRAADAGAEGCYRVAMPDALQFFLRVLGPRVDLCSQALCLLHPESMIRRIWARPCALIVQDRPGRQLTAECQTLMEVRPPETARLKIRISQQGCLSFFRMENSFPS